MQSDISGLNLISFPAGVARDFWRDWLRRFVRPPRPEDRARYPRLSDRSCGTEVLPPQRKGPADHAGLPQRRSGRPRSGRVSTRRSIMRRARASTRSPRWTSVGPPATQVTGLTYRTHVSALASADRTLRPLGRRLTRRSAGACAAASRQKPPPRWRALRARRGCLTDLPGPVGLACKAPGSLAAMPRHTRRPLILPGPAPGLHPCCGLPCLGDV